MYLTQLHSEILQKAFKDTLGQPKRGAVAFVRCLTPDVVNALAKSQDFNPVNWRVLRVGKESDISSRTITAGESVELREIKGDALLLLVDTTEAGAGMDGIYSASNEVKEGDLFTKALELAYNEVTVQLSRNVREYAERAVRKAKGYGQRFSISSWTEFDFLVRISAQKKDPGEFLYLLGLWPVKNKKDENNNYELNPGGLDVSRLFVNRLLGADVARLPPLQRIDYLKIDKTSTDQIKNLEKFLLGASTRPIYLALADLEKETDLWVNQLKIANQEATIQSLEVVSWRRNNQEVYKWSGLTLVDPTLAPIFQLDPKANDNGKYSKLEVQWKVFPENLGRGEVAYRVAIVTDMDEEIASREILHPGTKAVKARFSDQDFSMLSEGSLVHAKIKVSVLGNDNFEPQLSEEFKICYGEQPNADPYADKGSGGTKVRTLSEAVIDINSRELIAEIVENNKEMQVDSKGFVLFHCQGGKRFKVYSPPLLCEVEKQWAEQSGIIGRWRVKVRASGSRASAAEFVPFVLPELESGNWQKHFDRVTTASGKFVDRFKTSGVGQIYDIKSKVFEPIIKEYILSWAALLEVCDPLVALANTVEVQSLSGETIGLIVLPSHPLRVAWHVAYDNLVLYAKFEEKMKSKDIRDEFTLLDGAMFPPFLPGLKGGKSFVFSDMLGFHAVGMIYEDDKEPKASVALLARALGEKETAESVPTVGKQSAKVLGDEILSYIECHNYPRLLLIHALRAGDGLTVAKALGEVQGQLNKSPDAEVDDDVAKTPTAFVLDFYPSDKKSSIAGRFIAETREKRRSGAGSLNDDDRWMLESVNLSGGIILPKLRWARKNDKPKTAAHLAIAFDTFESQVVPNEKSTATRPPFAFGLLSFFVRKYTSSPSPVWQSMIIDSKDGNKHPSGQVLTKYIAEIQKSILHCVSKNIDANAANIPVLRTEISPDKADSLRNLHQKCDWVITLDRNAGVEYFDSPRDNNGVYDAFVIDCVPEREDLGCLQLITSTSNLDEVRNLLDGALDQMGLSRSRKNAEFLLENLKALSGRLAIRLTGQKAPASELIALALCQSNCWQSNNTENECWTPLTNGFLIPVDDVKNILPPLEIKDDNLNTDMENNSSRPDIIYVSVGKKGLLFQFIEVKYRRHLRTARAKDLLVRINDQVKSLRQRWEDYYLNDQISNSFQAIRRAKLARVLYFYADKARRHADDEIGGGISDENYDKITTEIDKMIEKGNGYTFGTIEKPDRGWVFCPECGDTKPVEISPNDWKTRVFLFGPGPFSGSTLQIDKVSANGNKVLAETPSLKIQPINDEALSLSMLITGDTLNESEKESQTHNPVSQEMEKTLVPSTPDQKSQTHDPASREMEKTLVAFASDNVVPSVVCLGQDLYTGSDVQWQLAIRGNPHLLLVGLPGMGKTTCLLNLCQQMLEKGITPIVFSYHDDIDKRLIEIVGQVRFVDYDCLGFNPLQVIDRQSRNAYLDVAGVVRDIFVAIYPELGDIQGESVRDAIKQSFKNAGWGDLNANLAQLQEPPFGEFLEILRSIEKPNKGLQTLLARLGELEDYHFFEMADQPTLSLWEDSKQPIVIRIHRTQSSNLQQAFASLVFYKFYKDMFRRGTQSRITHAIIFDEAHKAARLNLISTMAKECRKFGIALILASQEAKDFNSSLFSAVANYLVLRVTEADAKALVRNVSSADQEKSLIDKIKGLEKFKAMFFCEGRPKPTILKLNNV